MRELRPVCSLDVSEYGGGDINCAVWKPGAADDPGKVMVLSGRELLENSRYSQIRLMAPRFCPEKI